MITALVKEVVWQMIFTFVPLLSVLGNFAMVGGIAYGAFVAFLPAFYFYFLLYLGYKLDSFVVDVQITTACKPGLLRYQFCWNSIGSPPNTQSCKAPPDAIVPS